MHRAKAPLAALAALVACSAKTVPGSFVVGVDPHVHPSVRLDVTIKVNGEVQTQRTLKAPVPPTPIEIAVDPQGDPTAAIDVKIEGYSDYSLAGSTFPVLTRNARSQFVENRASLLPIVLDARCTDSIIEGPAGVTLPAPRCQGDTTCADGRCISPIVAPNDLASYSPRWADDDVCGGPGSASLEVARGDGSLASIVDGDTLVPEQGSQGGYHVFLAFRATHVRRKSSVISARGVEVGGPGTLGSASWAFPLTRDASGACSLGAVRWVLSTTGSLVGIQGRSWDMSFTIDDGAGGKATVTRRVSL